MPPAFAMLSRRAASTACCGLVRTAAPAIRAQNALRIAVPAFHRTLATTANPPPPPPKKEGEAKTGKEDDKPNPVAIIAVASILAGGYITWAKFNRQLKEKKEAEEVQQQQQQQQQQAPADSTASPTFTKDDTVVVFVLGGPGAGKGTNCARLVEDFGFVHLSAGDLLREEQQRPGSEYGELIRHYIKEGLIVPMEVTIALLHNAMRRSGSRLFLVDGFPRAMDQALQFEKTVVEGRAVLYFECPEEEMMNRLLSRGTTSGRADDNIESIRKRFRTFRDTSYPVIEYYEKQNKVYKVSCKQSPEAVYAETKRIFTDMLEIPTAVPEATAITISTPATAIA